ncbi:MAG: sugar ABC transporter permease [Candidatus Dadabacteria bacterium]
MQTTRRAYLPAHRALIRAVSPYLFVMPAILLNCVFFLLPCLMVFWISLHEWPLLGPRPFVGLKNYVSTLNDHVFLQAFSFTTRYTLLVTPSIFVPAILLALLLNRRVMGISIIRAIYFTPVIISFVAASLMWRWIYNDLVGIANYLLSLLGLPKVNWLGEYPLLSVIIMIVWKTVGYSMVLLLTGMQSIPAELYEAAAIDGAGRWIQFLRITLPLLRPTFALAVTISVIGSYLGFDFWYVLTGGGPEYDTTTVVLWIYRTAFQFFLLGKGAAMSVFLLAFLVVISYLQIRFIRTRIEY